MGEIDEKLTVLANNGHMHYKFDGKKTSIKIWEKKEFTVTNPDGTVKKGLMCVRCYQSWPLEEKKNV